MGRLYFCCNIKNILLYFDRKASKTFKRRSSRALKAAIYNEHFL